MSKTQKVILSCLIVVAFIATGGFLLRGYFYKPTVDQVDTLQVYINQKKASAESNHASA